MIADEKNLFNLICIASCMVDELANENDHGPVIKWQRTILGHDFSVMGPNCLENMTGGCGIANAVTTWLYAHEDAQVMFASVLVVVGLWWLLRAFLALVVNLICPLLVVLLAVVCVPQLRAPLLGQNYTALTKVLRKILLKLAENIE
ncbi:hypothetical protein ACJJTC_018560 [Scirpophaga incertulas]